MSGSIMDYGPDAYLKKDGTVHDPGPRPSFNEQAEAWARKNGYVKLDGIDVEALRLAVERFERTLRLATDSPDRESNEALWGAYQHDVNTLLGPAIAFLVALDLESDRPNPSSGEDTS